MCIKTMTGKRKLDQDDYDDNDDDIKGTQNVKRYTK